MQIRGALPGGVTDHDFQGQWGFAVAQWGSEGHDEACMGFPDCMGKCRQDHLGPLQDEALSSHQERPPPAKS